MMQRVRVTFARGEETKYITHLDMMRFWERAFRRAALPVAKSQGFHPHPRFSLASPLPVGVTSDAELMDLFLDHTVEPPEVARRLREQVVPGVRVRGAEEVALEGPSLQALMRAIEYEVTVESDRDPAAVSAAVNAFLAAVNVPWELVRDGETKQYDLRRQVMGLAVSAGADRTYEFVMRLQNDSAGAGRPEQVTRALGFPDPPLRIHRARLLLAEPVKPQG